MRANKQNHSSLIKNWQNFRRHKRLDIDAAHIIVISCVLLNFHFNFMQNLFLAELNFRENKITVTKTKCDYFRTVSGNYLLSGYFIGQKISGWSEWLLTPNLCVDMPSNIPNDMIWSENNYISLWVRFGVIVNVCNVNLFIQKIVFGSFSKFMNLFFFIGFNKYLCV